MRANDFLIELFDQPYPYTWVSREKGEWIGRFTTDDRSVVDVVFESYKPPYNNWEVDFSRGESFDIIGYGDQFKIFTTVLNMIMEFLNIEEPDTLLFDTDAEKSRIKLYSVMVKKFAAKAQYTYDIKTLEHGAVYTLTRNYQR